ncbi:MAG: RIP metalloprotease RseP [Pelagibacterales bacterium]|nr:RIP metalloprotease RseP [Pelagibacterales bacterium]OUU63568.1 MAG: RIP metalloprotease RseP [Alphaproteobacteria bacterium TMED62]|tara:strand:- start:7757 stop:9112 length:1356 start_codon:yes stop_codon:yes gene_type:complete
MSFIYTFISYSEYIFWFILVFTIIVFIHEFGHYIIARLNNVQVEKFSIGFGPVLFSKIDRNNTKWQIGLVPLGGYVKFSGEMYANTKNQKHDSNKDLFMNKKALQKASIVFAGPAANFILSFFLFVGIFYFFGQNKTSNIVASIDDDSPAYHSNIKVYDKIISINKTKIDNFEDIYNFIEADNKYFEYLLFTIERNNKILEYKLKPDKKEIKTFIGTEKTINYIGINPLLEPVVGKVLANSPAKDAGLKTGDIIRSINNIKILDARQIIDIVKVNRGNILKFLILRNNNEFAIDVIPRDINKNNEGKIGITFKKSREKLNFLDSIVESIRNIYIISIKTLVAFWEILFGKRDHCEVGGPILIAKVSTDVVNTDYISFIALIALISINLGLINLFPLPLLDGGHLLTFISEFIIGKNINYNLFKIVQIIGVALILSFMIFSILNDIYCRVLN